MSFFPPAHSTVGGFPIGVCPRGSLLRCGGGADAVENVILTEVVSFVVDVDVVAAQHQSVDGVA